MKSLTFSLSLLSIFIICCNQIPKEKIDKQQTKTTKLWKETNRQFLVDELKRTRDELLDEIQELNDEKWNFKEESKRWSIAEIVEHLEVQDELYFREIFLTTKTPQSDKYIEIVKGKDKEFLKYAVDTVKGNAGWTLEPIGRYCSKESAMKSFIRTRNHIIKFVEETDLDLRRFFTFRKYLDDSGLSDIRLWDVRDLHQLLLTTIAHTDRHLNQLRNVKRHPKYQEK